MKEYGKKFVRRAECVRSQAPELSTRKRLPRIRDDKRKQDQEKVASSGKDVRKKCQGEQTCPDKQQASSKQAKGL